MQLQLKRGVLHLILLILATSTALAIDGVKANNADGSSCVNYACGANDGICPNDFGLGNCNACDTNCAGGQINTAPQAGGSCCGLQACDDGSGGTICKASCSVCGNGVVEAGEQCDGGTCCTAACTFKGAGIECRASINNACDPAETCSGASSICPADTINPGCGACALNNICEAGEAANSCSDCWSTPTASMNCPASITEGNNAVLTLTGTYDSFTTATFAIDTNRNGAYDDGSGASSPYSVSVAGLTPGTYTFNGRVQDTKPRSATASCEVQVLADAAPTASGVVKSNTPRWQRADVVFTATVSDNAAGTTYYIIYGDGQQSPVMNCGGQSCTTDFSHTYNTLTTFSANVVAVDSKGQQTVSAPIPVTITSLACNPGTQAGSALVYPYDNDPSECCTSACTQQAGPQYSCYETASCNAEGQICAGSPGTYTDRDASQTACEANSQTCTQYTWATCTYNGVAQCAGDDATDYPAAIIAPTASCTATVCNQPNQCYSNAGTPGCWPQTTENTGASCSDVVDNDCDGIYDHQEDSCYSTGLRITITLHEDDGRIASAVDQSARTKVTLTGDSRTRTAPNPQAAQTTLYYSMDEYRYEGDYTDYGLWIGRDTRTITVTRTGFRAVTKNVVLQSGEETTVNVDLYPRRCNADCTNDQGYCDVSCIGVGGCMAEPTPDERATLDACSAQQTGFGYKPGAEVVLGMTEDGRQLVGVCCVAPVTPRNAPVVSVQENVNLNKITTLVKYTRVVTLNGRVYKLVINTWE